MGLNFWNFLREFVGFHFIFLLFPGLWDTNELIYFFFNFLDGCFIFDHVAIRPILNCSIYYTLFVKITEGYNTCIPELGFPSNYSDFLIWKKDRDKAIKGVKKVHQQANKIETPKTKTKLSYHEKRELDEIESIIEKLELQKEALEVQFQNTTGSDVVALNEKYAQASKALDDKVERWEYLSIIEAGE